MKQKITSVKFDRLDRLFLFIYLGLIIFQSVLISGETAPPLTLRLVYWMFAFIPAIIKPGWMAGVTAMLYTISAYGFAYGYMPYENHWYILFSICALVVCYPNVKKKNYSVPIALLFLMLYVLIVDFIYSSTISNLSMTIFLVILLILITNKNDIMPIKRLSIGFAVASFVLSFLFVVKGQQFARDYGDMFERMGWYDPNYFGMVLLFGTIASMFELFNRKFVYRWEKWLYILVIIITIPTSILNGSRGALLALVISGIALLYFTKIKILYKILILLVAITALYFMYAYGSIFDFLVYRIENDDVGGGSGRIDIWTNKIELFLQSNPLQIIFGLGGDAGLHLGGANSSSGIVGFHSDYVGYLVKYGIVGIIVFLSLLLFPLFNIAKDFASRPYVIAGVATIAAFSFTLEPYSSGGTSYWLFYLYILFLSMNKSYFA